MGFNESTMVKIVRIYVFKIAVINVVFTGVGIFPITFFPDYVFQILEQMFSLMSLKV